MSHAGYLAEIAEQPEIIRRLAHTFDERYAGELRAIASDLEHGRYIKVVLTGMGGSVHSAYPAFLDLSAGSRTPAVLWDSSELVQQVPHTIDEDTLVIAVSQSGKSAELVRLTELPNRPARVISITNGHANPLAQWADVPLVTEAGPENTASTKTYTAGLAALYLTTHYLLGKPEGAAEDVTHLTDQVADLIASLPSAVKKAATFLGHERPLVYVGRGPSHASAAMAALLTEEAAKLTSQPLTGGQFRHGPLELVREGFSAVVFAGAGDSRERNARLIREIVRLGGRVVVVGTDESMPGMEHVSMLPIPSQRPGLLPILEIIPIQFLVIPLAIARGFVPAAFLNASKITSIE